MSSPLPRDRGVPALDVFVARAFDRVARNPIRWALVLIFSGILFAGTIFSLVESKVSMPDGWWWAFVSMTTVGYGDIAPKTPEIRFLAIFVIATGIASTAILTATLAGRITERRLTAYERTPEMDDDIDHLIDQLETMKTTLKHPRVVEALRAIHEEEGDSR
jgi:hypothetical protein